TRGAAVSQRPANRADRHGRGEGRQRPGGRGRVGRATAAAAADPAPASTIRRGYPTGRARSRRVVQGAQRDPAGRFVHGAAPTAGGGGAAMTNPVAFTLRRSGEFFAFSLDTLRSVPRRPWQVREFVQQAWFISSVSILPAALVSI